MHSQLVYIDFSNISTIFSVLLLFNYLSCLLLYFIFGCSSKRIRCRFYFSFSHTLIDKLMLFYIDFLLAVCFWAAKSTLLLCMRQVCFDFIKVGISWACLAAYGECQSKCQRTSECRSKTSKNINLRITFL